MYYNRYSTYSHHLEAAEPEREAYVVAGKPILESPECVWNPILESHEMEQLLGVPTWDY